MHTHKERCAVRLTLTGLVQGIGYRPFVRREALKRAIGGFVQNSGGGVSIYACGEKEALDSFVQCLLTSAPLGTQYTSFDCTDAEWQVTDGFTIEKSDRKTLLPIVMPDLAPCGDCTRELFDAHDRRYRYPFISCALCGPRFSVQSALPYDRARTSMADFEMCPACTDEYDASEGRRSYAQTLACPDCGPQLTYYGENGLVLTQNEALDACIDHIRAGGIAALKNIGGFHLACRADDEAAVCALRLLKGREEKPFALLFSDIPSIRAVAQVNDAEEKLLTSPARPIVLLRKKPAHTEKIAPSVCPNSLYIGAMLASSPLQLLLTRALGCLVMTSANRSGEPLEIERNELVRWLPPSVGILDNDRPITAAEDDSLCFVEKLGGEHKNLFIRRARGYAPLPIRMGVSADSPMLSAGGDLKAVFALVDGSFAYASPYIGDLESQATAERYAQMLGHMSDLLGIRPSSVACDLHPNYHSAKISENWLKQDDNERVLPVKPVKVQHHHAHIASVMAEHGLTRVLGFAFDGTGYGSDGTVWGGELTYCEGADFTRLRHLLPLPMLGGDSGATDCRRTAATFLIASGRAPWDEASRLWNAALKAGVASIMTSSMGRLFDAAAAILDVCVSNAYEGQAATMLEAVANEWLQEGGRPSALTLDAEGEVWLSDRLLLDLLGRKEKGEAIGALALGFHLAIADSVAEAAETYGKMLNCRDIALSGGCFANRLLLTACHERLGAKGFSVYINEQLPAGDGNIALGQAYIAALRNK